MVVLFVVVDDEEECISKVCTNDRMTIIHVISMSISMFMFMSFRGINGLLCLAILLAYESNLEAISCNDGGGDDGDDDDDDGDDEKEEDKGCSMCMLDVAIKRVFFVLAFPFLLV